MPASARYRVASVAAVAFLGLVALLQYWLVDRHRYAATGVAASFAGVREVLTVVRLQRAESGR